jgi:hypothetical protein
MWWFTPAIPAHRRWRQEDWEFEAILGYTARSCPKKKCEKISQVYVKHYSLSVSLFKIRSNTYFFRK